MTQTPNPSASSPVKRYLESASAWAFSVYAIAAAFTTYFCMYGYRKAFAAAEYAGDHLTLEGFAPFGEALPLDGFAMKSALVISQLAGYALSKFIGIKINSELSHGRRALALIACIGISEISLLAFAVLPPWGKVGAIFLSGLPLGMVWGMVFSFLEGRRLTELLGAGLCCSFIVASGVAKTVGTALMDANVPEYWMPFVAGLVYLPPFLVGVWLLCQLPEPSAADVAERVIRVPMDRTARLRFLKQWMPGLVVGFVAYIGLTIFRDYRDNFAPEIFKELGIVTGPAIYTKTEVIIALSVISLVALLFLVRDNRKGFFFTHLFAFAGAVIIGVSTWLFDLGKLDGLAWIIGSGFGAFLAYVPFNCIFYDRMIAALGTAATAVFCITVADSLGYTGTIGVMIYEQVSGGEKESKVDFFRSVAYSVSLISSFCVALSWIYFSGKVKSKRDAHVSI